MEHGAWSMERIFVTSREPVLSSRVRESRCRGSLSEKTGTPRHVFSFKGQHQRLHPSLFLAHATWLLLSSLGSSAPSSNTTFSSDLQRGENETYRLVQTNTCIYRHSSCRYVRYLFGTDPVVSSRLTKTAIGASTTLTSLQPKRKHRSERPCRLANPLDLSSLTTPHSHLVNRKRGREQAGESMYSRDTGAMGSLIPPGSRF